MSKSRDDFKVSVIKELERRVNGKCSNPEHRVHTSGPKLGPEGANNIGIAAHIKAAAPGGPRFDLAMSKAQRGAIENGIWLCTNCATMIDRDPQKYPVELLYEWKNISENIASDELGRPPVSRQDFDALYGLTFGGFKKDLIPAAVEKVCKMTALELQKIDPRFEVNVEHVQGKTSYIFSALEPVPICLEPTAAYATEFVEKLESLLYHGEDIELDSDRIKIVGSALFERDNSRGGRLLFSPSVKKAGVLRIVSRPPQSSMRSYMIDIPGEITFGRHSYTFKGEAYNKMFSIRLTHDFNSKKITRQDVGVNLDFWNEKPINSLPYFSNLFDLYEAINHSEKLDFKIEVEGLPLSNGSGNIDASRLYIIFRHIRNARFIFDSLGMVAYYKGGMSLTADEIIFSEKIYSLMKACENLSVSEMQQLSVRFNLDKEEVIPDIGEKKSFAAKTVETYGLHGKLLGENLSPIKISRIYTSVVASPDRSLNAGDGVWMTLHPTSDCQIFTKLELSD